MAAAQRKTQKTQSAEVSRRKPRTDPQRLKAFAERLNAMMSELGVPERGRARVIKDRVGVGGTAAQNWLRGNSYPSFEELGRIGRLGLDPSRLLPQQGDMVPAGAQAQSASGETGSTRLAKLLASNRLIQLRRLHTDDGEWNHTALPHRVWQQLPDVDLDALVLMFMKGDAMGERIPDGTPLLIDPRVTQISSDNGIYALLMGETVMVRRVQRRLQGGYLITCDNPLIAPETIGTLGTHQDVSPKPSEVLVLGRVVLAMQKL